MKRTTAKLIADALNRVADQLDLRADVLAAHVLGAPLSGRMKRLARDIQRAGLFEMLLAEPEPTPQQLAEGLAAVERIRTSPAEMRRHLKASLRSLPRTRVGPKRKLSPAEEIAICEDVRHLSKQYARGVAIGIAARKRNLSDRTVYRALQKHGETRAKKSSKTAVK